MVPDYSCSLKVFKEGANLVALSRLFHSLTLNMPLQLQSSQVLQFLTSRTAENMGNHIAN